MARIHVWILLVGILVSLASAGAPTFCKCTCFKNSTIIALGPQHQTESRSLPLSDPVSLGSADAGLNARTPSTSCSDCTKAFCLNQGLAICKKATEEDVFTLCFQRDSNKDKIMVWGFIIGTLGLLGYAAFKRVLEHREGRASTLQAGVGYAPVAVQ
ncbi:hypothetical protein VHEMI09525 [[Torrubiella] hemipterigena]|uniref:MFS transporter n=1 Tax=[Torrubiella] hemipterigena TaxID=1531966 RepID=A0A0A1TQG2_9HYPO|nr:hypothetical protein VHEMI09525 [[Torrubiella] hemipterigena]